MNVLRRGALAILASTALAVAACGGGAPNVADPAGAVNAAFGAVEAGGLARVNEFVCAANAGDPTSIFGGDAGSLEDLQAAGVDPNELVDAMKIDFENIQTTETSKSGSAATVHVTGDARITLDEAKFREIMKKVMEAQGLPTDDATIDGVMQMVSGSMSETQAIDEDVELVQENGKWLIC